MTRGRALVALLLLGQILAAPHAGGAVKRLLGASELSAQKAPAAETVARKARGAAKTQPSEARRIDPVCAPARVVILAPPAPRPGETRPSLPSASVPAPVALLALAPKLPPPPRSLPA